MTRTRSNSKEHFKCCCCHQRQQSNCKHTVVNKMKTFKTIATRRVATAIASSNGCDASLPVVRGIYQPATTTLATKRSIFPCLSFVARYSTQSKPTSGSLIAESFQSQKKATASNKESPLGISYRSFTATTVRSNDASYCSSRPDPLARRPNQKCDPYGQGGKPLSLVDAKRLLTTVDSEWKIDLSDEGVTRTYNDDNDTIIPISISREFFHDEFIDGSIFISKIAALSQMNNHYPTITLGRHVVKKLKQWQAVTTVTCHTKVLKGLSHHDFHLAMVSTVVNKKSNNNVVIQSSFLQY